MYERPKIILPTKLEISLNNFALGLSDWIEARAHVAVKGDAAYPHAKHAAIEGRKMMRRGLPRRLVGCVCSGDNCEHAETLKAGKMEKLADELIEALTSLIDVKISQASTPHHLRHTVYGLDHHPAKHLQKKLVAFITEHGKEKKRAAKKKSEG